MDSFLNYLGVALLLVLPFALFSGEPDLIDAIIFALTNGQLK